jgi:integrase/recombinase XerD
MMTLEKENLMYLSKGYKGIYDLYYTNPLTGKRTKVSTGKSSYRDAIRFRNEFNPDEVQKSLNSTANQSIDFLKLQELLLEYCRTNFSYNTCELYKRALSNFLKFTGNKQLSYYTAMDIENFKNFRTQTVRKTSANMELRTIKASFNFAIRFGFIKDSPAAKIKQFKLPEKEKLAFSDKDLQKIFGVITDPVIGRIALFALHTGCRLSEILNIQIKDIDYVENFLTIRNKADFKTKTGKIRQIPISEAIQRILWALKCNPEDYYLFSFNGPTRLNRDYVSQKFKKYLRQANLPEKFHFHCLRHTFITNLIKNGVSINFVKELAGHTEIKTTMGYVHIELKDLREAIRNYKIAI